VGEIRKNKLFQRFIIFNVIFYLIVSVLIVATAYVVFENIRKDASLKYAEKHAAIFCNIAGLCPDVEINARSFIIDRDGFVQVDSLTFRGDNAERLDSPFHIEEKFYNPNFIIGIREYLKNIEHFLSTNSFKTIEIKDDEFCAVRIVPMNCAMWSVVTLYCRASILTLSDFMPLFVLLLLILVVFVLGINIVGNKLIFSPLWELVRSLESVREDKEKDIYGIERQDELGDLSKAIKKLFHEAHIDTLTGVYNRRHMEKALPPLMKLLSRSEDVLSMLMIDIDCFKDYNDTYGHDAGDKCLKAIGKLLSENISRSGDLIIRYGGEEFLIVLPNTDENGARIISERLIKKTQELKIVHESSDVSEYVTISIGAVTGKVSQTETWQKYVSRADEALYISKNNNRNTYTFLNIE